MAEAWAGLPREVATPLAAQTVLQAPPRWCGRPGSIRELLKDQVTSPGGTTIAGLHALRNAGCCAWGLDRRRPGGDARAHLS